MTEFQQTIKLFTKMGLKYKIFTDPDFLHEYSKRKQDLAVSITGTDLNFNNHGDFIGVSGESNDSWEKPSPR